MPSSLVRTGFVRGTLTQGNGCYQHRCRNKTLEVQCKEIFNLIASSLSSFDGKFNLLANFPSVLVPQT
jgi:hypothetical protein